MNAPSIAAALWWAASAHAETVPAPVAVDLPARDSTLAVAPPPLSAIGRPSSDLALTALLVPRFSLPSALSLGVRNPAVPAPAKEVSRARALLAKAQDPLLSDPPVPTDADKNAVASKASVRDREAARRDPMSQLSDRDKAVLAAAAERIAQRLLPWIDLKLLRKLELLQTLQLQNVHMNWNVQQKSALLFDSARHGSPIILNTKASLDFIPGRWQASWLMAHPLDGKPTMQLKSQFWYHTRFHADVGYQFVGASSAKALVRYRPTASLGWRLGIYDMSYSYGGGASGEHAVSLGTLF